MTRGIDESNLPMNIWEDRFFKVQIYDKQPLFWSQLPHMISELGDSNCVVN
jgi:hypothetical protein